MIMQPPTRVAACPMGARYGPRRRSDGGSPERFQVRMITVGYAATWAFFPWLFRYRWSAALIHGI
jgi:hypothetical protein